MSRNTFPRSERLRSYHTIRQLYREGITGYLYPYRYSFIVSSAEEGVASAEILIAISKKRVPRAVARNRIRRRIREAYRLNKAPFFHSLHNQNLRVSLIVTYIGDETTTWQVMEKKIVLLLQDIVNRVPAN